LITTYLIVFGDLFTLFPIAMREIIFILALFNFTFVLPAPAQERIQIEPQDTTLSLLRMKNPEQLLEQPIVLLPLTFALAKPEQNMQMSLYQTFAGTPQSFAWERNAPTDLTAPLKLQLYQSEPEKAFRITLGAAGTAGALYMAYKHVKKYGLK
jgi:hypothetical protein